MLPCSALTIRGGGGLARLPVASGRVASVCPIPPTVPVLHRPSLHPRHTSLTRWVAPVTLCARLLPPPLPAVVPSAALVTLAVSRGRTRDVVVHHTPVWCRRRDRGVSPRPPPRTTSTIPMKVDVERVEAPREGRPAASTLAAAPGIAPALHTQRRHASSSTGPATPDAEDVACHDVPPTLAQVVAACKVLGLVTAGGTVQTTWTSDSLKATYRALARQYHPDLTDGDERCMEQINAAYAQLRALSTAQRAHVQERLRCGDTGVESDGELREHGYLVRLSSWFGFDPTRGGTDAGYVSDLTRLMAAGFYTTLVSTLVWCSSCVYGRLVAHAEVDAGGAGMARVHGDTTASRTECGRTRSVPPVTLTRQSGSVVCGALAARVVQMLAQCALLAAVCVNAALLRRIVSTFLVLLVK